MKINEIRELSGDAIQDKIDELNTELFQAKLKHATHQLQDKASLKTYKHKIAQLKTVLQEKKLASAVSAGGQKK